MSVATYEAARAKYKAARDRAVVALHEWAAVQRCEPFGAPAVVARKHLFAVEAELSAAEEEYLDAAALKGKAL